MRIWSLHPRHLDQKGLVACWRETLLAQKVLQGGTTGYRNHPQLLRFQAHADPLAAIAGYLSGLLDESRARGYRFDATRIGVETGDVALIPVTTGQLAYELGHLRTKLEGRAPERVPVLPTAEALGAGDVHPLFRVVPGPVEEWERR